MVAEQPGLSVSLFLDSGGGELEAREVLDVLVGEYHPKAALYEFGHFFTEEGFVLGSRSMATSLDAEV